MYPNYPPIWCSESEVPQLMDIVEKINAITASKFLLFNMTKTLAKELFTMIHEAIPTAVENSMMIAEEKVLNCDENGLTSYSIKYIERDRYS